jgi:hypothetical protein
MLYFPYLPFLLLILCFSHLSYANIPSAYLACEGAELGDRCSMPGPQYGTCTRDTLCNDPIETMINECILCVDDCWNLEEGNACTRRFTGTAGVCQQQDQCTDKPETSFQECNRCVDQKAKAIEDASNDNCQQGVNLETMLSLLLILGCLFKRNGIKNREIK